MRAVEIFVASFYNKKKLLTTLKRNRNYQHEHHSIFKTQLIYSFTKK